MRAHPLLWRRVRIAAIFLLGMIGLLSMPFFVGHGLIYHPHPYPANYRRLFPAGMLELQFSSRAGRQTAFYLPARNGQTFA